MVYIRIKFNIRKWILIETGNIEAVKRNYFSRIKKIKFFNPFYSFITYSLSLSRDSYTFDEIVIFKDVDHIVYMSCLEKNCSKKLLKSFNFFSVFCVNFLEFKFKQFLRCFISLYLYFTIKIKAIMKRKNIFFVRKTT